MAFGKFAERESMFSATPVENMFLLEFMPNAPGDFVRVYLYGLMMCHHPDLATGLEGVASALNMDEDAVMNACRYWEREGLMVRQSDNPPTFAFHSCQQALNARPQIEEAYYADRDFNAELQNLFGADMLLHPKEYTMASDWVEVMKLPQDVVLYMVRRELKQSQKKRSIATVFKRLDETAVKLADRDIRTVADAEAYFERDEAPQRCARAVLDWMGLKRPPTKAESALADKWLNEWMLSEEVVQEALSRTTNSQNPSFKYVDAILDKLRGGDDSEEFARIKQLLSEMKQRNPVPNQQDRERYRAIMQGGFEYDVVLAAARTGGRTTMEGLEELLYKWAEQGIFTMEAYERFRQKRAVMDQLVSRLFERAGMERRPRQADRALMEKWQADHPMEMILLAGELSRGAETPMRYIDATLARWKRDGIATPEAAKAAKARAAGSAPPQREAGNFAQRTYTQAEYDSVFTDVELEDEQDEGV